MPNRVEWLKLQMRYCSLWTCCRLIPWFTAFEVYYRLCALIGYRARHFLERRPSEISALHPGDRVLITWPPDLPFSIWLLDRIVPLARMAHAESVTYTPEAEAAARRAGCRIEIIDVAPGEFKAALR